MSTPRTRPTDDSLAPHGGDGTVDAEFTVVNEFTAVRVRKILTRNGQRLEITSLRLDHHIRLDALALEGLTGRTKKRSPPTSTSRSAPRIPRPPKSEESNDQCCY